MHKKIKNKVLESLFVSFLDILFLLLNIILTFLKSQYLFVFILNLKLLRYNNYLMFRTSLKQLTKK